MKHITLRRILSSWLGHKRGPAQAHADGQRQARPIASSDVFLSLKAAMVENLAQVRPCAQSGAGQPKAGDNQALTFAPPSQHLN
ncbi:MAG: hypothetical protein M3R45_13500 [Pseudomonadota bacterium]|nr:hypothetical protein [Pseudomonadota bacterium]